MEWEVDILYVIAELKTEWHCVSSRLESSNCNKRQNIKEELNYNNTLKEESGTLKAEPYKWSMYQQKNRQQIYSPNH